MKKILEIEEIVWGDAPEIDLNERGIVKLKQYNSRVRKRKAGLTFNNIAEEASKIETETN